MKQARERAEMRRVELAAKTGLAANTIRNYEEGITPPSLENLRLIAEAIGVDRIWLIDGDRMEVA